MHEALAAGLKEQLAAPGAAAAAAAAPAPAVRPPAPAATPPPVPSRPAAVPSPPPPPAARPASDPEATAQIDRAQHAPLPPQAEPAQAASHYSGRLPRAQGVVRAKKKRHWGRVIVILLVFAALIGAAIWFLAPKIRKLSLSSALHKDTTTQCAARFEPAIPAGLS